MSRFDKVIRLLLVLIVVGGGLLAIQLVTTDARTRPLGAWELREVAKGGIKKCDSSIQFTSCADSDRMCLPLGIVDCSLNPACSACDAATFDAACSTTITPFTRLNCQNDGVEKGGCGKRLKDAKCKWNGTTGECHCDKTGATPLFPEFKCDRLKVKADEDVCMWP